MYFVVVISFALFQMVNSQCGCGCGCCCCCDPYANIPTTPPTSTAANANPIPGITNRILNSNRLSMDDYLKVQTILDGTTKIRAKRYNYDLSAQLAADSSHYRHGDREELLEEDSDLDPLSPKTTTEKPEKPKVSIIGAINPQKLPGGPHIPPPERNVNNHGEEVVEEVPDLGAVRL